jgi:hypothetical protein
MHFGPDQVLVNLDVQFRPGLPASEVEAAVDRLEAAIQARHPEVRHIFLETESITGRRGRAEAGAR